VLNSKAHNSNAITVVKKNNSGKNKIKSVEKKEYSMFTCIN